MKKRTSNVSRRIVSLLMSMVLTLTLVTPTAFATEVVGGSGTAIIEGNANPADANPNEDTEGKDDVDKNAEDEQQPAEPDDENAEPSEGEDAVNEPSNEADTQEGEGTDTPVVAQRTVTVERYRTDAAYEVKIVVGVEEDGTTEKLDTTYTINADTKTVTLKLTTADYAGKPVYIKTALDDVLVTEGENQTPALTKDTPTLEYTLPEDGDVTLYYGTQEDFVSAWYTSVTDNKYTIRTAEELAYFTQLVNGTATDSTGNIVAAQTFSGKVITLARDIDLSAVCGEQSENWIPIGNTNQATFRGTFDGQSHTVSEIYINNDFSVFGLFGYVKNGEVTALTVSGTIIAKDGATIGGGIAGSLDGGTITKCTSNVVIEYPQQGSWQFYYGGIVGDIKNGSRVSLCENYGNIRVNGGTNGSVIGGIVGKVCDIDSKVENCKNNGAINAVITVQRTFDIGGIVGINAGTVTQCRNLGNLSLTNNTAKKNKARKVAGGVVGKNETASSNGVINCSNDGVVTLSSRHSVDIISGIVADGGVANCYNWGDVKGSLTSSTYGVGKPENVTNSYYICKINSDDTVDMKYINKAEQDITYEEAAHTYKVGEDTLVKTLNENRGSDGLKWFVNISEGITKPIFVKQWDGTDHPDYVPDGTEKEVHVTYDPNGGGGSGTSVSVAVTLNEDGTVKAPGTHTILDAETAKIDEKDFCELKDWNVEANGEGTTYTIGQDVSVSEDLTLYAQWELLWKGSGTESDPYQIENEADWLKMQKYAGKYSNYPDMWFALMDDITLDNYEPFFFRGNLMGNGNTITVDVPESIEIGKHTRGLFSSIIGGDVGIRIENLTVAGSVAAYSCAGGLAGNITGKVTLENVTSNVTVKAGGYQYDTTSRAGGLCGSYSRDTLTVKNCRNEGTVTGHTAGGLVGSYSGMTMMDFSGCTNSGTVRGEKAAAGLLGFNARTNDPNSSFTNCSNTGEIIASERAAGIAVHSTRGKVEGCTNSGAITGDIAAGILCSGVAKRSVNTGKITGKTCGAGIAANNNSGYTWYTMEFCANFGEVTAVASVNGLLAFGIARQGKISNCFTYNKTSHVPISGVASKQCTVSDSYYLANSDTEFPSTMGGTPATLDDFASGKVAWGVDGGTGAHKNYWTQGANNYPVPIGEGTSTSYYRAKAECGTGGAVSIKSSRNFTGDADIAVYGPKGMSVTVTATPKDNTFGLKSLTWTHNGQTDVLPAAGTTNIVMPAESNGTIHAEFASVGPGGNGGYYYGGSGDGTGTGDKDDEGLQDGLNMDVEYDIKGLVLGAYAEWGSNGGNKSFQKWLEENPNVVRALLTNSLDNMATAAVGKKTDEAKDLAALLLASLNEHTGVDGKNGDTIAKALQKYIDSGSEEVFSAWLTGGGGMASGTYESIYGQYASSLAALADRLYSKWEASGTSMTFPVWLDSQQVTMESLSENAEEPDAEPDDTQTTEAPEDVPDGQDTEGGASGNSVWEVIGTVVRENPIIVWSIVAVVAALVIVGAVRRYHKVKRDERDDVASKK